MTPGDRPVRTGLDTVAVLGAGGTMGFAMARNIARAPMAVRAWNRSGDKAEPLAADGVYIADTAHLVNDADALRRRLADEGYLFFHGLLPAGQVQEAGHAVLAQLRSGGWRWRVSGENL